MQKFDILDPELDIFQSYFLEASAGTGKTFAIEHLFLRLLLESKEPIELPEILAVTFTREAAHEMKGRIREKLLSSNHPRVQTALALFDEIQVFTIHGFCHKMLSEYPFEAKVPLQLCSPDQSDPLYEMRKTVEDFFQTGDSRFSHEVGALLKQSRFDFDRLVEEIVKAMEQQIEVEELCFPQLPLISLEDLRADLELLTPRYKRLKEQEWLEQLEPFYTYLQDQKPKTLLDEKTWFFEKMFEENVKVKAPPLESLSLKAPSFFQLLESKLLPKLAIAKDRKQMVGRVAAECKKRWKVKAQRHDHFSFDDLLKQMKRAVSEPLFCEKIRQRYQAVIVDEFQDTDPTQWAIFETLFAKEHLIYLVGDPKQSIYGFRSADIYTYMRALKQLGEEKKAYLDTNYRSSPQLVAALNTLFTKRADWISLPSLPGALNYHPVKAGRNEAKLEESPLVIFGAKGEKARSWSFPTKEMEEELLFPYVASEILRLSDKIPFSQMAILIKDRYHAHRVQLHLNLWKIPSHIKRSFHLAKSAGFLEMELFLEALMHPEDPSRVQAILRQEMGNPFFALRALFEEKGFAPCFANYIEDTFCHHADSALYSQLRQTAEILMEERGATLSELLHTLQELKTKNPETDPRLSLRGEEGEVKVPILTTFASKGLEFDVVFALDIAYEQKEETPDPEKEAEKMRKLYVALTRAREKLYIPYVVQLDRKKSPPSPSPIEQFFQGEVPEEITWISKTKIKPYRQKIEIPQLTPPAQIPLEFEKEYFTSFSSMAKPHVPTLLKERFGLQNLAEKTPHTLPLGAETGTLIHAIFEAHFSDRSVPTHQITFETLNGTHLEEYEETIAATVEEILHMPLDGDFKLCDLKEGDYFAEMEFLFPKEGQLVKGFADLIFKRGDTFCLLDWKTNWLGPSDAHYTQENMEKVMREHDYYLQAELYQEAILRYVKRLYKNPNYGGAYYVFFRGKKAVHFFELVK